ncbi:MAG TPA: purine nucleoside permease [Acidobacteriaceae bacterium]|nr:purine nucleoside permease [Acidobacteriaceae bacterium]
MTTPARFLLLPLISVISLSAVAQAPPRPIPVKVVVVTTFEVGADTGDVPGELQHWVEHDHLDRIYPLPAGYHAVRMNSDGEMAIVTGEGASHAAATIMALGLDPRFDLSHAYWLIAAIAGGNPQQVSLGSAVWARWVVDGDLAYEIDAREIPAGWSTGYVPLGKNHPFEEPAKPMGGQVYALNQGLVDWAFDLTRTTPLEDTPQLKAARSSFDGAAANRPPFVTLGDELSSSTYWHGKLMDEWAARWVPYFTGGKGVFAATAMEDSGALQSLQFLANADRVDWRRVMVLRTVSNFDEQPRGMDAADSLAIQRTGKYAAYLPSLETAYRVGHVVVNELVSHWPQYENSVPKAQPAAKP